MDHNNNLFADNQQFNAYDNLNLFQNGTDSNFNDASWGVNASEYGSGNQSRGQHSAVPGWQQNANHLSATSAGYGGQASPYGRTLNQSPVPFAQNQFQNFGQQQNFQYRQSPYDPSSLVTQPGSGQNFNLGLQGYNSPAPNSNTITPQALERGTQQQSNYSANPYANHGFTSNTFGQTPPIRPTSASIQARPVDQKALAASIPKGADSGMFNVINFDSLARVTNSEGVSNYVNSGRETREWDCTRSVVPTYIPRKSRNQLRALAGNNPAALAKIGKKSKKERLFPTLLSDIKSAAASSTPGIKYEHDSSSSDDSSDDDEDSSYTDSDDEESPLPAKRPDSPRGSVEYDTIKALWHSKRRTVSTETVRKSLVNFWELVKIIRDRWKIDAQAVTDAEEKKRTNELPLLQSRVKDQRDMIEAAFKAALKHGHKGIIELLSENVSLMYLCYQFLLDRFKADDVNGSLSRAMLETMSMFTTLTNEKLEKTHLNKVLPRYQKKGDAKTQYWAKKIIANADIADKAPATKPEQKKSDKPTPQPTDAKLASPSGKRTASESVAGVKRAATTSGEGTVAKKVATTANKVNGTAPAAKTTGGFKKPTLTTADAAKSTAAGGNATAARKTVVPNKSSGFFAGLTSASKKPGTSNADKATSSIAKPAGKPSGAASTAPKFSFAETMANLAKPKEEKPAAKPETVVPNETPEEREKRLRKEKRRKLNVRFKDPEDLVEIRYFTHDPEEEMNHDSSQMRDMAEVGGEGRALKQHQNMMDIDDEEEAADEVVDFKEYTSPSLIDFSDVDPEERKRNYAPYGGGELEPESAERAVRDYYESNNLIVIYTDRSQIPPNPREPTDPYNGESGGAMKTFGAPDEKFAKRARELRAEQQSSYAQSNNNAGGFDMAAFMRQQQPQQAAAPPAPDISSILASLRAAQAPAPAPAPAPVPAYNTPYMGGQPSNFQPPTAPPAPPPPAQQPANGGLDPGLMALLASFNNGNNQQNAYGGASSAPVMNFGQQPQNAGGSEEDLDKIKAKNPFYKTRVCKFWQDGRCQKGEACSFLHE